MTTHLLALPDAEIAYDIHGPLPAPDGRRPLLMIGQPMDASGFEALVARFADRTVITYDPRGLGRSLRHDGRTDNTPQTQAGDVHTLIQTLDAGPVDLFASSGGAVTALALVAAHPGDIDTLVAHEPPLQRMLPDADAATRAWHEVRRTYDQSGWGAGMAEFIRLVTWPGVFTDAYFAQPPADPAAYGLPVDDDGSRDDPLLSERSQAVGDHRPDLDALTAAPTRIVLAAGEETGDTMLARTTAATARALGAELVIFPSHHSGFMDNASGMPGQPDGFATRLRDVLDTPPDAPAD